MYLNTALKGQKSRNLSIHGRDLAGSKTKATHNQLETLVLHKSVCQGVPLKIGLFHFKTVEKYSTEFQVYVAW